MSLQQVCSSSTGHIGYRLLANAPLQAPELRLKRRTSRFSDRMSRSYGESRAIRISGRPTVPVSTSGTRSCRKAETSSGANRTPDMKHALALLFCFLAFGSAARASTLAPGIYERSGHPVYVGVEHELPDAAGNDFFDPRTQQTDSLNAGERGLRLRSGLHEERRVILTPQGRLGVSLYYADAKPRATILLVHGNDAETREMGFIIPFFACNGINVLSYDQRGTGDSRGNWFLNGPIQRAQDAAAIYDAFRGDRHVDSQRIGVWGFSNGGWTAPIVAVQRPLAFMILKSAPAESLKSNIDYEVVQLMRHHGQGEAATRHALALWQSVEAALDGTGSWKDAKRTYDEATAQPWFAYSLMPKMPVPPTASLEDGFRRAISYDPTQKLQRVRVPTLAIYGALDHNVDAASSSARMRRYFKAAGMRDFTMHVYPRAGHLLIVSNTGYNGDPVPPQRFVPGYPQVMLTWLAQRGFTKTATP
jgi:pimeloyl-ACP methyl ester carboxylesterase